MDGSTEVFPQSTCACLIYIIACGAALPTMVGNQRKGEATVTQSDFANEYRKLLLTRRLTLLAQIAEQRGGVRSRADVAQEHFAHSEDSAAQVASERDVEFALNERETAELGAIDAALERIDAGTYGLCSDCGGAITPQRLHALPEAARCITCQERAEQLPQYARA